MIILKIFSGWAMEARICAEDPMRDFMPTPGPVNHLRLPSGPYTRTDTREFYAGSAITADYPDPDDRKSNSLGHPRETLLEDASTGRLWNLP